MILFSVAIGWSGSPVRRKTFSGPSLSRHQSHCGCVRLSKETVKLQSSLPARLRGTIASPWQEIDRARTGSALTAAVTS
jgi:hypothetical protein